MSDNGKMDVMVGSPHLSNLDEEIEDEFENKNRGVRKGSSEENGIRSNKRSDG